MSDDPRPLSQQEIDALFAELAGAAPTPSPEPSALVPPAPSAPVASTAPAPAPAAAAAPGGRLSQADIDALLSEVSGAPASPAPATPPPPALAPAQVAASAIPPIDGDEDALTTKSRGSIAPASERSRLSQGDIDDLLSQLGAGPVAAPTPGQPPTPPAGAAPSRAPDPEATIPSTESFTPEALSQLIAKHAQPETQAPASDNAINQEDIDALVRQMSDATVGPPGRTEIGAAMAERGTDIDALLGQAAVNLSIADAVSPRMTASPMHAGAGMVPASALLSGDEVRGAKLLLVAAVFMLLTCTVALIIVASSVNGLGQELRTARQSQVQITDDFSQDLAAAESFLASSDEMQRRRGELHMQNLKKHYRSNPQQVDRISLRLAHHFRSRDEHVPAAQELRSIVERPHELNLDPTLYLEYADSLLHADRPLDARRIAYRVIGNEARYLDPELRDRAALERNAEAVRQAWMLVAEATDRAPRVARNP